MLCGPIVNCLLEFAEIFIILIAFEKKESWIPYLVKEIADADRKLECPIRFEIHIDASKLTRQNSKK